MRREARAGALKLGCVFPFVTKLHLDLERPGRGQDDKARASKQAIDLLRYSFFVDCDFALAEKTAGRPAAWRGRPAPKKLIAGVLGFVASDRFVAF